MEERLACEILRPLVASAMGNMIIAHVQNVTDWLSEETQNFLTLKLEKYFRKRTMVLKVDHILNQSPQMSNKCSRTISYCRNFPQGHMTKTKFGGKKTPHSIKINKMKYKSTAF